MKRSVIIFFLSIFLSFNFGFLFGWNVGLDANKLSQIEQPYEVSFNNDHLWSLINNYRVSKNLKPFIKDPQLCRISEYRLPELKNEINNPHAGFTKYLIGYVSSIPFAENNTGAYSDQNAMDRWLASPSHKKTLEMDWTHSCVVCSEKEMACVEIFAKF